MGNILQIAVLGHIHGRMCPVPAVIGAVIGVEHIVARILQVPGCPLGFFHITTHFLCVFTGNNALGKALQLGLHRIAQGYREILAAGFLDGMDHLHRKAIAVLKASAVFVRAFVEKFDGKLIQQIPLMNRVHFHAVHTGILTKPGRLCEGFNDLMDLLFCHLRADDIRCPAGRLRAGRCQLMGGVDDRLDDGTGEFVLVQRADHFGNCPAAAHARRQLNEELCTGLMDFIHKHLQFLEHLRILPQPFAPEGVPQGRNAGDDQTHVVVGPLQKQLGRLLVKATAGQLKPAEEGCTAHGAHDNAVFDLHVANLPWGKQGIIFCVHR